MREEEFRTWLEEHGANTDAGRNTRAYAVRTIEKNLDKLGIAYSNLETAWQGDQFKSLRQKISELRDDFDAGGEKFRILMPQSKKPRRRLASWASWLGQYGRFLSGEKPNDRDADRIRRHVLENYIEPAREREDDTAELIVKQVNDALGLHQAWPNICQAMTGRIFHELADVPPPQRFGADMSTATRFRFDLDLTGYWALGMLNHRLGPPISQTKKMAAFALPDGRQVALDLEAARTQLWVEGQPGFPKILDLKLQHYVANAPRHSNLPPRLKHSGSENRNVSMLTIANGEVLGQVLDVYEADGITINRDALDRLRNLFKSKFPDFEASGGFQGQTTYHKEEDDYKRALIDQAKLLIAEKSSTSSELGGNLLDLIANKTELQSNLLGWRMADSLEGQRLVNPDIFENAAAQIALGSDPLKAIMDFVETTWPILSKDKKSKPYSDSRTIPSLIGALVHPDLIVGLRTDRFNNIFEDLLGSKLFKWAPLEREELDRAIALARQLFDIMQNEWRWQPRDLWDVQGFIWVSCAKKLRALGDEMTDDQVLARFDRNADFHQSRQQWSETQKSSFCAIARAVHHAGLDWWHVNVKRNPVRFGRKSAERVKAEGVMGQLTVFPPKFWFNIQSNSLGMNLDDFLVGTEDADRFLRIIEEQEEAIEIWITPDPPRPGLWPDETAAEVNEQSGDENHLESEHMKTNPTNLILYGPPGTGKTYETMSVAVRLCGEQPAAERVGLKAQYERLRNAKQIEFITFHQNFAYEEFVEGLRPQTENGESEGGVKAGFGLKSEPGIFRKLCTLADEARKSADSGQTFNLGNRQVFKMSLGRAGLEDDIFEDAWTGDYIVLGWGGEIDWSGYDSFEAIRARWNRDFPEAHGSDSNIAQVNRFVVDMKPGDLVVISYGNKKIRAIGEIRGPYKFDPTDVRDYNHRRQVRWLKRFDEPLDASIVSHVNFSQKSCYLINDNNLNRPGLETLLPHERPKQFTLIIDEINRANISKVFGELITLIEPDKRLGMENELTVRLPYSNSKFGVPANLHIVGTMNTADRSIAQLDTALRRRFQFKELPPRTSVPAFQKAQDDTKLPLAAVLNKMNERIEYLVDRDHRIGHAFFIGCKTMEDVDAKMRDNIIPLLQEYFFDNWDRLASVLGEAEMGGNFLKCKTIEDPTSGGGDALKSWRVSEEIFKREDYDHLIGKARGAAINTENSELKNGQE